MEDYIKIYEECLNRSYHNEKIEPIINNLYDIVNYYDRDIKESSTAIIQKKKKKYYDNIRKSTMDDLLNVFNIIIEKNNYYDLNEVIAFAFELDLDWTVITNYLNVIYNLEYFDKENNFECDMVMMNVTNKVNNNEMKSNYNFPFYQLISCYKKYDIFVNNNNIKSEIKRFFNRYSVTILYYFYLNNYDVQELEKMYDDIINHFEYYISIFEMNTDELFHQFIFVQDDEKRIIRTIIDDRFNNKKLIR